VGLYGCGYVGLFSAGACPSFDITVPQFNPSLGTLGSVTWSFTDYTLITLFLNEYPGDQPYSLDVTAEDTSSVLGLDATSTQESAGSGLGGDLDYYFPISSVLTASGIAPDSSPFLGTGMISVVVTPSAFVSNGTGPDEGNGGLIVGLLGANDYAQLTVTYNVVPTPEPRGGTAFLLIAFLSMLWLKARTTPTHF